MSQNRINTTSITQLLQHIRAAELSNQKELRIPISDAKQVAFTLGLIMTRLAGDYETLINKQATQPDLSVKIDGGNNWGG